MKQRNIQSYRCNVIDIMDMSLLDGYSPACRVEGAQTERINNSVEDKSIEFRNSVI